MSGEAKSFAARVAEATGENPSRCYQCGKCTAGCPMAERGDMLAHQVLRLIQLGEEQEVLAALQPWLCVSCQTCMTRCPQKLDLSKIMDYLRQEALKKGTPPPEADRLVAFNQVFVDRVTANGRLNEAELGGFYNLRTRQPFANLTAVPGLLVRGKIRLPGKKPRGLREALGRRRGGRK